MYEEEVNEKVQSDLSHYHRSYPFPGYPDHARRRPVNHVKPDARTCPGCGTCDARRGIHFAGQQDFRRIMYAKDCRNVRFCRYPGYARRLCSLTLGNQYDSYKDHV